ncbi:MAG: hypothetical protein Q7S88_02150 [Candidatus Daviesbacteria bacterium]|nr:hypothetical protein [Candidatus Daviesbacteria bacterium]
MIDTVEKKIRPAREVGIVQPEALKRANELLRSGDYANFAKLWEEYERRVAEDEVKIVCLARRDLGPYADLFVPAADGGSHPITRVPVEAYHGVLLEKFWNESAWVEGAGNSVPVGSIDLLAQSFSQSGTNGPRSQNYVILTKFSGEADYTKTETARYECHVESKQPGTRMTWSLRKASPQDLKVAQRTRLSKETVNG